jgi:hypothetical protein
MNDITPLDEAVFKAYGVALGFATMAMVREEIVKSIEGQLGSQDRTLPSEVRAEALQTAQEANNALSLVASAQAVCGISA